MIMVLEWYLLILLFFNFTEMSASHRELQATHRIDIGHPEALRLPSYKKTGQKKQWVCWELHIKYGKDTSVISNFVFMENPTTTLCHRDFTGVDEYRD